MGRYLAIDRTFDLQAIGLILMIAGVIGLGISIAFTDLPAP